MAWPVTRGTRFFGFTRCEDSVTVCVCVRQKRVGVTLNNGLLQGVWGVVTRLVDTLWNPGAPLQKTGVTPTPAETLSHSLFSRHDEGP